MEFAVATSKAALRVAGTEPATRGAGGLAITDAPELLSDIGYLLVHGMPIERGPAYLLVAIRPRPTRHHFDPERIEYWAAPNGVAQPATLEWPIALRQTPFSWGTIKIVDRVAATNSFVSFGGLLSGARDGELSAALFRSEAPILATSGRGSAGDPLATRVAAFFARLRAACGTDVEFARRSAAIDPMALYGGFLLREMERGAGRAADSILPQRVQALLRSELCLLARDFGSAASAGERFMRDLDRINQPREEVRK